MAASSDMPAPIRRGVAAVFLRELDRMAHTPFFLMFEIVLPIITFTVLSSIFYEEIPRDMPVLVCDNDGSPLTRDMIRRIDASASMKIIQHVGDMEEAKHIIREGRAYAVFLMPAHLEQEVLRGVAPAVTVYYNNQCLLTSGIISRSAREVVVGMSLEFDYYARIAAGESSASAKKRVEPIRLDSHPLFNPNMNYRYFLLPVLLPTVLQMFMTIGMVHAIGREFRSCTAGQWLDTAGDSTLVAVFGKIFPHTVIFLLVATFMWVWLTRYCGVPITGSVPFLLGATVAYVLAYQSVGALISVLAGNLRTANSIAGFYTGPAFAVSGVTFPVLGMPFAAKIWHSILPLSYYMKVVQQQTLKNAPIEISIKPTLAIIAFILILFPIMCLRLRHLFRHPEKWGQP